MDCEIPADEREYPMHPDLLNTTDDNGTQIVESNSLRENSQQNSSNNLSTNEPFPAFTTNTKMKDITKEFFEAVKELELGELVRHEVFGLFEAMSAIEMMDPKMDAGMLCNNSTVILTFEGAIETNKLKLSGLDNSELIGVMDGIYSCLVSWLDGHSLAQTLFTCLYLHQPYAIEDKSLRTFCIGIYKITEIIRKFVECAKIFEEEDFEPREYNYFLKPDCNNTRICFLLKEAEDELMKKFKSGVDTSEENLGVMNRLKFLRLYLQALIALWPKNVIPNEGEMGEIQRLLNNALDTMPTIKKTIAKGTQPIENSNEPNPMGFSPMVNRRILPPTFPRYTKIKDRTISINFLNDLVLRTKQTCRIIHCNNYHSALNFFMDFSKKSSSCLLSRSILQCLYLPQPNLVFGTTTVTDMLRESAKLFILPPVLMPRSPFASNAQVKACVDTFFKFCSTMYTFVTFIQICGLNRARQRDKLAGILDDFANLQDEAERVDGYLLTLNVDNKESKPYFTTWVLYYCLRAMLMYVISGLELGLYSLHEYMYIYWYLSEIIIIWIISTLSRTEYLSEETKALAAATTGNNNSNNNNNNGNNNSNTNKQKKPKGKKKNQKEYSREIKYFDAMKHMFSGYYKALVGFTKLKCIPQPLSIFDNERIRFDHRFAPFQNVATPPPVSYDQFCSTRSCLLYDNVSDLFTVAGQHFHYGRIGFESIQNPDTEITDAIRVAKTNFVVMNLLATGHRRDSKTPPDFDFSNSDYFPTIKLP